MKIAIIGATGFIGKNLTSFLLHHSNHELVLFARSAKSLSVPAEYITRVKIAAGDIQKKQDLRQALEGCDAAVYLVHLMGDGSANFMEAEKSAAHNVAGAAKLHKVSRLVYISSMGEAASDKEQHLASRNATGNILRTKAPQVIQLSTPMIIGDGSAAYELLRGMVLRSPLFILPKWARTRVQPIAVDDVISYIYAALTTPVNGHQTIEIGGPEKLTYAQIAQRYAQWKHKKIIIVSTGLIPMRFAVWFMYLFRRNKKAAIAASMIESASATMIVQDDKAQTRFQGVHTHKIESAFS